MIPTYEFEGQQRPFSEIRKMVSCLGESTVRTYLRAGMKTRSEMLAIDPRAKRRATRLRNFRFGKRGNQT